MVAGLSHGRGMHRKGLPFSTLGRGMLLRRDAGNASNAFTDSLLASHVQAVRAFKLSPSEAAEDESA